MRRLFLLTAIVASCTPPIPAAPMVWPIQISPNGRYFVDHKGQPVFWLGTTQWELFRGYTREDTQLILDKSRDKGFVFVQTMLVGVGDGTRANVYGQKPWLTDDPLTPNEAYFQNVDAVIQAARERGLILYVMAYHQTCRKHITIGNARAWAKWLARRYKEVPNIIWSLIPEAKPEFVPILRELAAGLREGDGGAHLITVEPDPSPYSSSFIHHEPWLAFNSVQTWKGVELIYPMVTHDYNLQPVKPVLMAEGAYEQGSEYGFDVTPLWIRRQAYYSYLAGGYHAYGHNDSWRILPTWRQALDAPGARQMGVLREIFEARPEWWRLIPDQSLFAAGGQTKGRVLHLAAHHAEGLWAVFYLADPAEFSINLASLRGPHVSAAWVNPATGASMAIGAYADTGVQSFTTPTGWEDSLLILESQGDPSGTGVATAELVPEGRDSTALAAAIQHSERGTTIRLPPGTFELTESVRLKSGVKLIGAGQDQTVFIYSGDKPDPFISLTDCEDVEIAHLTLDGRSRPLGQDGIRAGNCRKLLLHHLTIHNLAKGKSSFVHGIIFSGRNPTMERGVTDSTISDCRIETVGLGAEYGGGIRMAWGSVRNRVEHNVIRATGRGGIFGDHSAELVIRHNQVSGSGGEGLGIEIWGGCPRSLLEDNVVDHWISVDQGNQSAVRRNIVGVEDDSLKGYGIEIIASDVIATDNLVKRGAAIGLSVSNKPKKNNVFWGYNTIRECVQWGAQLQGETGGIAHHYFYRCTFEKTIRGDPRARYPRDSGHGFRFNGSSRGLVFEDCSFLGNGAYGVQFVGLNVDTMTFLRCVFADNRQGLVIGLSPDKTVEFKDCTAGGDRADTFPPTQAFSSAPPVADFRIPPVIRVGAAAPFACTSRSGAGEIVERLWDFNHGIAEVGPNPEHTFDQPGKYRVALIVWDAAGRGARAEKIIEVLPGR